MVRKKGGTDMKILCIDDKNRPDEIPIEKWVVEGREYTPIFWSWHVAQGIGGGEVEEIALDETNKPYTAFRMSRFVMDPKDLEEWMAIGKVSKELIETGIVQPDKDFVGIPARERIHILQ